MFNAEFIVDQIDDLIKARIAKHFAASDRQAREHSEDIDRIKATIAEELGELTIEHDR